MRRDVDPWYAIAACREHPEADALFFPTRTRGHAYRRTLKEALTLCRTCPVREECLADALRREGDMPVTMRYGVYGGVSPDERARLAARRRVS